MLADVAIHPQISNFSHNMALTWPHLLTILNCSALFFSLALVGLSPPIIYLTAHGVHGMNKAYPQGYYEWYRGPSWDMDTKHEIRLMFESTTEEMLYTAGAAGVLFGVVGIVGFFLARRVSFHPLNTRRNGTDNHRHPSRPHTKLRSSCRSSPAASYFW